MPDTDRYGLTLPATATVAIQVDRRFSSPSGDAALADPWAAVVPASDLPDAWDYAWWGFGPDPANGPCADPAWFDYPYVVPDWVWSQGVLSEDPAGDPGFSPAVADPAASPSDLPCAWDRDQDGIADVDEARPATLQSQVLQRQAEHLALDPDFYAIFDGVPDALLPVDATAPFFGPVFVDADSTEFPDDEQETSVPALGLGGRAVATGEEATWHGTLPPGDYVVVVGGTASAGPYDLSVRLLLE